MSESTDTFSATAGAMPSASTRTVSFVASRSQKLFVVGSFALIVLAFFGLVAFGGQVLGAMGLPQASGIGVQMSMVGAAAVVLLGSYLFMAWLHKIGIRWFAKRSRELTPDLWWRLLIQIAVFCIVSFVVWGVFELMTRGLVWFAESKPIASMFLLYTYPFVLLVLWLVAFLVSLALLSKVFWGFSGGEAALSVIPSGIVAVLMLGMPIALSAQAAYVGIQNALRSPSQDSGVAALKKGLAIRAEKPQVQAPRGESSQDPVVASKSRELQEAEQTLEVLGKSFSGAFNFIEGVNEKDNAKAQAQRDRLDQRIRTFAQQSDRLSDVQKRLELAQIKWVPIGRSSIDEEMRKYYEKMVQDLERAAGLVGSQPNSQSLAVANSAAPREQEKASVAGIDPAVCQQMRAQLPQLEIARANCASPGFVQSRDACEQTISQRISQVAAMCGPTVSDSATPRKQESAPKGGCVVDPDTRLVGVRGTWSVVGDGRLPFYSAPDIACPKSGVYVVPGDKLEVNAVTADGNWVSVKFVHPKTGRETTGWVNSRLVGERLKG